MTDNSKRSIYIFSVFALILTAVLISFNYKFLTDWFKLRTYKTQELSTLVLSTEAINVNVDESFQIINSYLDKLKLGFRIKYEETHVPELHNLLAHNIQSAYRVSKRAALDINNIAFTDYDLVILLDNTTSVVSGNIHGQYYFPYDGNLHFLRGKTMLLDDPILFAHELMHQQDLGHTNTAYENDVFNVLSECFHITDYTFEKNQVLQTHTKKPVSKNKIIKPVSNENIKNETVFSCDLWLRLAPTELDIHIPVVLEENGCGNCDNPTFNQVIGKTAVNSVSKSLYDEYPENQINPNYKYSIEPEQSIIDTALLTQVLQAEYKAFKLQDLNIITESEFVERKMSVLLSIMHTNVVFQLVKKSMKKSLINRIPDKIWTNRDTLNKFISFAVDYGIVFDSTNLISVSIVNNVGEKIQSKDVEFKVPVDAEGESTDSIQIVYGINSLGLYSFNKIDDEITISLDGYQSYTDVLRNDQIVELSKLNQQFYIKGTVLDKATQTPIKGASVNITSSTIGTITNDAGEYKISVENPSQDYSITISRNGYITTNITTNSSSNPTIFLNKLEARNDGF